MAQAEGAPVSPREFIRVALCVLAVALPAASATLSLQPGEVTEGHYSARIELLAAPGEEVSGLQFEIVFSSADLAWDSIAAGTSTANASKMVSSNLIGTNRCRVIIAGFNQTVIPNGPVATARWKIARGTPAPTIENPILSDPSGKPISARTGTVQGQVAPQTRKACGCGAAEETSIAGDFLLVLVMTGLLIIATQRRYSR